MTIVSNPKMLKTIGTLAFYIYQYVLVDIECHSQLERHETQFRYTMVLFVSFHSKLLYLRKENYKNHHCEQPEIAKNKQNAGVLYPPVRQFNFEKIEEIWCQKNCSAFLMELFEMFSLKVMIEIKLQRHFNIVRLEAKKNSSPTSAQCSE